MVGYMSLEEQVDNHFGSPTGRHCSGASVPVYEETLLRTGRSASRRTERFSG